MDRKNHQADFLKVDEAARLLRVSLRTVYRRIWNGELPASKVGGIYLIPRKELLELVSQSRTGSALDAPIQAAADALKCGRCLRLISSPALLGEPCQATGCEQTLCLPCSREGHQYCAAHTPSIHDQQQQAEAQWQKGEITLLVRSNTARLREINTLNRIQARLAHIKSLAHPYDGEVLTIPDWAAIQEVSDQRGEVMRLLGKVMLDGETLAQLPLNVFARYRLPAGRKSGSLALEIEVQVLSRLETMARQGYDSQPLGEEHLNPWLARLSESARQSRVFKLAVLASTTGWDDRARQVFLGRQAFGHELALFYLFDLETGELLYNQQDERARQYAELFAALLPSEEMAEIIQSIEQELTRYDSLTLAHACRVLPFSQARLREAFERLAATERFELVDGASIGLSIMRRTA